MVKGILDYLWETKDFTNKTKDLQLDVYHDAL